MTLVGYIPARSGSKRLKNKNFKDFSWFIYDRNCFKKVKKIKI